MILILFPFQAELDAYLGKTGKPKSGATDPALVARRTERMVKSVRAIQATDQPDCLMAVCGQGKVEAALTAQILIDALDPSALLLLGSATALDASLKPGDIALADPCIEWDFGSDPSPSFRAAQALPKIDGVRGSTKTKRGEQGDLGDEEIPASEFWVGPVLSGDRNVFAAHEKAELGKRFGALALAWEGAGFHRCLRRNQKPGWELRLITEAMGEGQPTLAHLKSRLEAFMPALRPFVAACAAAHAQGRTPT